MQVAPAELESLLLENDGVADAAVVGVTVNGDEVPRAYIVKVAKAEITEKSVADWVERRVAKHKFLRGGVVFVDAIPKNPVLRERAAKEVGDLKAKLA
ncbi:unnamed protein product [Clonostachys rosea]|uniref:AMP-binding enzyme C-terminal domain-containing protein n=1 Tax=Bionectria ochroleuca TaxID=29856 RepID=A0ABY6UCG5_BIOOC|nr:unnamed protein product [Clonostachys rosea]